MVTESKSRYLLFEYIQPLVPRGGSTAAEPVTQASRSCLLTPHSHGGPPLVIPPGEVRHEGVLKQELRAVGICVQSGGFLSVDVALGHHSCLGSRSGAARGFSLEQASYGPHRWANLPAEGQTPWRDTPCQPAMPTTLLFPSSQRAPFS